MRFIMREIVSLDYLRVARRILAWAWVRRAFLRVLHELWRRSWGFYETSPRTLTPRTRAARMAFDFLDRLHDRYAYHPDRYTLTHLYKCECPR